MVILECGPMTQEEVGLRSVTGTLTAPRPGGEGRTSVRALYEHPKADTLQTEETHLTTTGPESFQRSPALRGGRRPQVEALW